MAQEFIPKNIKEFSSKTFWNDAFEKSSKPFDWYGDWHDMNNIISHYLKHEHKILIVGCGNSSLGQQLYDYGYKNVVNIDYSETVIEKMKKKYAYCKEMVFETMDATHMTFEDHSFDFIIDKACLDAMYSVQDEPTVTMITSMFNEIKRVLKPEGYYLCITLAQQHVFDIFIKNFSVWYNRYFLLFPVNDRSAPQPFLFLSSPSINIYKRSVYSTSFLNSLKQGKETKHLLKPNENVGESNPSPTQHHFCTFESSFAFRRREDMLYRHQYQYPGKYVSPTDLFEIISKATTNHSNRHMLATLGNGDIFEDTLYIQDAKKPSYTVRVYDVKGRNKQRALKKLSIIFVPIGRELEYSFNNPNGLEDIGMQIQVDRLIMIYIHREVSTMEAMQDELTPYILMLYPDNCDKNIPFMKVSDELGKKVQIAHMKSGFSGDIFVEDITVENISKRRLIFGNNRNAIQTEYIFTVEKKKKNKKKIMRYNEICFDIYKAILSLVYIHQSSLVNPQNHFLIMGLGGGSLCSYLYSYLLNEKEREAQDPYKKVVPLQETTSEEMIKALEENQNSLIQCVEIDETIAKIANEYFQLCPTTVFIHDAYEFMNHLPDSFLYQCIILDIDNKDVSKGLTFPPTKFLTKDFLLTLHKHLLEDGALIVNISSHNASIFNAILFVFKQVFKHVYLFNTEDLNKCLYASEKDIPSFTKDELKQRYGESIENVDIDSIAKQLKH